MGSSACHAARPSVRKDRGLFLFVPRNVYQHRTAFAQGVLQLTASSLKPATITCPVIAAAFARSLSLLDTSAPSCLLMRVNGFVPQPDAGQLTSRGRPDQSRYVGKRISLSFSGSGKAALEQISINALAGGLMSKRWYRSSHGETSRA
jgi:hypothetical protein